MQIGREMDGLAKGILAVRGGLEFHEFDIV